MRSVFLKISITVLLLLVGTTMASAKELTLDDCIQLALQNRSSIIAARGRESLAGANKMAALGAFLPRLNANYRWSKGKETDIVPVIPIFDTLGNQIGTKDNQDFGPSKNYGIDIGISVFNLSNVFNYFGSRASKARAGLDVINSEDDLIFSVKTSYYAYLAAEENVDVQDQAVERSKEQLKLIQSRFDLGSAAKSDVLKQKVQVGNDRLAQLRATNAVVTSKAMLAYTIGVDPASDVSFSTNTSVGVYSGSLNDAIGFGINNEPGLLAADMEVSASRLAVKSRWAQYIPTVSASYSLSRFEGTQAFPVTIERSSNTRTWGYSVSWNIFDGFSRERNLSSAKINLNNARAELADTRNRVTADIKTAWYDIEVQKESINVANENVAAAEEDLKITQEKYNLGAATILDLLDAQVSLKQAQTTLIRAEFDSNLALARLDQAIGKR